MVRMHGQLSIKAVNSMQTLELDAQLCTRCLHRHQQRIGFHAMLISMLASAWIGGHVQDVYNRRCGLNACDLHKGGVLLAGVLPESKHRAPPLRLLSYLRTMAPVAFVTQPVVNRHVAEHDLFALAVCNLVKFAVAPTILDGVLASHIKILPRQVAAAHVWFGFSSIWTT